MPTYAPTNINLTPYQRFYADAQGQATLGPSRRGRAGEYLRHLLLLDVLQHRETVCRNGPLAPPDADTPARDEWRALTDALLYDTAPPYPLPTVLDTQPAPNTRDPAAPAARPADPKLAHLSIIDIARALRHAADALTDPAPTKRIRAQFADLRQTAEALALELATRAHDLLQSLPDAPPAGTAAAEEPDTWREFMSGFTTAQLPALIDEWRRDDKPLYVQHAEAELARRAGQTPPPVPVPQPPADLTDEQTAARDAWNADVASMSDEELQQFARERMQALQQAQANGWHADELSWHRRNLERLRTRLREWGVPWPADAEQNTS